MGEHERAARLVGYRAHKDEPFAMPRVLTAHDDVAAMVQLISERWGWTARANSVG
jgi:hypothetical protein